MKLILSPAESEEHFHTAMCNGLDYICSGYGLSLGYSDDDYSAAKQKLLKEGRAADIGMVCFEDVLMQILKDGKKLSLVDEEGGEDKWTITIKDVHEKMSEIPANHIIDVITGDGDAVTADVVLQTVFIGEVMFG